jgi:tetratricopeptide (TPR) repeat protein
MLAAADGQTKHVIKGRLVKELVEADDLLAKAKFIEAADRYHDAINRDPKNVQAHTGMGTALGKQFKLDAADEEFDKALAIDPQNAMAHVGKAMININRLQSSSATVQKARESYLKEAESQARQALAIDANMPEAHLYLGQALREQGRLDEAAQELQTAIQADSEFSEAYAALGMVRLQQNSFVEAAANFNKAVALNSGNSTGHYGLGRVALQEGRIDDAIHELNTALYQYPNSAPVCLALGQAYLQQGNQVAAVREFHEAIRIKPETAEPYLHIAGIREGRGDIEHAIAELRSGVELMPENADLHLRIAENSLRLEKLDDAIKEYTTVLNTTPQNATAAKGITRAFYLKSQKEASNAYFASNEYAEAQKLLDKAIALNPNDMELRLAQAKMRALAGERVDLHSIGQPKTDGERVAYAEALLAQDRFADAHQQINQLLSKTQDVKQTLAIADLSLMIKDLTSAEVAYKKAASLPGGQERAKRGLDQVARAREAARQDATLADDLARRNALASAIDRYHAAIYANPELADARVGLGA